MLLDSAVYSETSSPSAALARQLPAKLRQGFHVFENNRDMYGFAVRPQHLQRYRKYASIYKEEETERSERWELFLRTYGEENAVDSSTLSPSEMALDNKNSEKLDSEDALDEVRASFNSSEDQTEKSAGADKNVNEKIREMQIWGELRPSLKALGQNFGKFLKRRKETEITSSNNSQGQLPTLESQNLTYASTTDAHGFVDVSVDVQVKLSSPLEVGIPLPEVSEGAQDKDPKYPSSSEEGSEGADARTEGADAVNGSNEGCNILVEKQEEVWNDEELRSLVRGGVPMALRGELWQVFAGTRESRTEGLYNKLLNESGPASSGMIEKWKNQIEKDLPRTFPGHPSLDEDGRNALRRLLTAYARHSPEVGYCQAMNFFAALLLLLMPEENAFWTLTAIINDYFEGFYSEKMLEAQVDQLVFGDLVKENFPKLISHLEALGVQVTWVSGTWFLSIFVNVLPWESVLRVWDVLLFDGNRSMLFRTALALMDIHAPTLMAAHDAGDAITLLQSMAGSTFDSSQLVFTACMGFQTINEQKIHSLRLKHRPDVIASLQQRSLELQLWRTSQKSMRRRSPQNVFKVGPAGGMLKAESGTMQLEGKEDNSGLSNRLETANGAVDDKAFGSNELLPSDTAFLHTSLQIGVMDDDEESDLQEQIFWLKTELCRALEEKNSALIRVEELELALMEIVKEDNRRLLTAKLEKLEHEVAALNQEILDKEEQERAMLQVMLRMEQEQKVTEDARRFAEEDAALQRHAANILQEKYEKSMKELALMEKRAVMAESTLEATMQYQALDNTSQNSPRQFQSSFKGEESKRRLWPLGSSARNIQSTVLNSKPCLASPRANLNLNVAGDDATDLKLVDKGTFQESSETKIS